MPATKIAIPTRLISHSLKNSIPIIAQMGAAGIQMDVINEIEELSSQTAQKHFLKLLSQHGLSIGTTFLGLTRPLTDAETLESQITKIKNGITLSSILKVNVLTTHIGPLPEEDAKEYPVLIEVLNDLARHANHTGVTLALSPMNESPVKFVQFLDKINQGPVALNFDPASVYAAGHSPSEEYQAVYKKVTHVVVRDSVRQLDGAGLEVPFGEGDVDWDEMFALLYEGHYEGWMTVMRTQGTSIQDDLVKTVLAVNLKTLNYWQ
jgi:sugar phosphate isomerase/epimerase